MNPFRPSQPRSARPVKPRRMHLGLLSLVLLLGTALAGAGATSTLTNLPTALPLLPDVGASLLRMLGALALVIALFLGGVWLLRHGQPLLGKRGRSSKLRVVEARSLGGRQALYVVGYAQQRLLVASSPAGVSLLTTLPNADETEEEVSGPLGNFAQALQHTLSRK